MKRMMMGTALTAMVICGGWAMSQRPEAPTVETVTQLQLPQAETTPAWRLAPWEAMEYPITALVMAMVEHDLAQDDPDFYWTSLYYLIGMTQTMDYRVIDQGDTLLIPTEMVQDCAYALYGEVIDLPPVPTAMTPFVSYDQEELGYVFGKGDASWSDCFLLHWENQDGKHLLQGEYVDWDGGQKICDFTVTLEEGDGMFGYHLTELTLSA